MYTQEELQKAAERLAATGTPYLGRTPSQIPKYSCYR